MGALNNYSNTNVSYLEQTELVLLSSIFEVIDNGDDDNNKDDDKYLWIILKFYS